MNDQQPGLQGNKQERYARHLTLPGFDEKAQQCLTDAHVLVIGCGGLGHPVLQYLTAAGVGIIAIADADRVAITNLQRQVLFTEQDVGSSKVEAATNRLHQMNSQVEFQVLRQNLQVSNSLDIIRQYDLVIDCSDNFPTRYLVNDACVLTGKPFIYGAIFRFEGQVALFNHKSGIDYRDMFPLPPPAGLVPDCEQGGVLGTLAGTIGCMMANEAIKLITGIGEVADGKLLLYDALANTMGSLQIKKRKDNPLSGDQPTIFALIDYDEFCGSPKTDKPTQMIKEISAAELKAMMDSGEDFQLIDVRETYEFEDSNMGGELIPMNTIPDHISDIARDKPVVIHCKGGTRSGNVVNYLQSEHGFTNLMNLKGGIMEWKRNFGEAVK